jgi:homoserine O-acetyltransferase
MSVGHSSVWAGFYEEPLRLSSGQTFGPITIRYTTYGHLDADKSNAILVCHALSGDADAGVWWETQVGSGKAIDTDRYFVICTNTIGSCYGSTGPASLDSKTGKPYGLSFPVITISDMVRAQKGLIDSLELPYLCGVVGGSMGGMQALEWSILYPDFVKRCVAIATSAELTPQALAFNAVGREAIISDPNFQDGNYSEECSPVHGLSIARMIGHITYRSEISMMEKFGRRLSTKGDYGYDFSTEFELESYLKYQGDKFVNRFDANCYLYLAKAMSYFDLAREYGSLDDAFLGVSANYLILSISTDWLYPSRESKRIVKSLMKQNKQVTYAEIQATHGHDSFLMENEQLSHLLGSFLENESHGR